MSARERAERAKAMRIEKLKKMLETWRKKDKHINELKLETIEEQNLKS